MRRRMRDAHSAADLAAIYAAPHDSDRWPDHQQRVDLTELLIAELVGPVTSAADLSCGNGNILRRIPATDKTFGDLAPGYEVTGPIEDTLLDLDRVDLLIMSETIEHLDDPDAVLRLARMATDVLVLTTPTLEYETRGDGNQEHYWSWGVGDVADMLVAAGFTDLTVRLWPLGYYTYQAWVAR